MGDSFEKRQRERRKREKRQDKALRRRERAADKKAGIAPGVTWYDGDSPSEVPVEGSGPSAAGRPVSSPVSSAGANAVGSPEPSPAS